MAADLGYGISYDVLSGPQQVLDDTFAEQTAAGLVLGQDQYMALTTPSKPQVVIDGGLFPLLWWENPPVSFDVRDNLLASLSPSDEATIQSRAQAIYAQDLRFTSFSATCSLDQTGNLTLVTQGVASGTKLVTTIVAGTDNISVQVATS